MTATEYIDSLDKDDFRIERCKRKIERLEVLSLNLNSKPFDNDRVKSSGSKDRIGDLTVKILEEKEKLAKLIDDTEDKREYIVNQIDSMDNLDYSKILYYRHIEKMRYEDIADMLDLAPKTIRNNHTAALKTLNRTFIMP